MTEEEQKDLNFRNLGHSWIYSQDPQTRPNPEDCEIIAQFGVTLARLGLIKTYSI